MLTTQPTSRSHSLAKNVRQQFNQSGYLELRSINIVAVPDGVCLSGCVRTYYLKQLAQSLAMMTDGVAQIDNDLEVL